MRGDNFNNGRFAVVTARKLETVDLVIQNIAGPDHPFHLHGKPMAIMARGNGLLSPRCVPLSPSLGRPERD